MSTGKRLAKRSIVGSRVAAPIEIDLDSPFIEGPALNYDIKEEDQQLPSPGPSSSSASSSSASDNGTASDEGAKDGGSAPAAAEDAEKVKKRKKRSPSKAIFYLPGTISKIQNWIHATYYTVSFNITDATSSSTSFSSLNAQQNQGGGGRQSLDQLIRQQLPAVGTFKADQLIGPGFNAISSVRKLYPGQRVFITYKGRETNAMVISHDYHADEVTLEIDTLASIGGISHILGSTPANSVVTLTRKLDEIRLLESRKSTRLQGDAMDYTKLASGQVRLSPSDAANLDHSGRRRSNSISSSSSTLTFSSSEPTPNNHHHHHHLLMNQMMMNSNAQPHGLKRRTSDIEDNDDQMMDAHHPSSSSSDLLYHPHPMNMTYDPLSKVDEIAMEDVEAALVLMKLGSPKVVVNNHHHHNSPSSDIANISGGGVPGSLGDHSNYNYWAVANMSGVSPESGVEACSPATPSPPSQEVALINSLGARYAAINSSMMASKSKKRFRDLTGTQDKVTAGVPDEQVDAMEDGGANTFNYVNGGQKLFFNFNAIKSEQEVADEERLFQPVKSSPSSASSANVGVVYGMYQQQQQQQQPQNNQFQVAIAQSSLDEGIDLKNGSLIDPSAGEICVKTMKKRVIYECTWPGCGVRYKMNAAIERHVRSVHLVDQIDKLSEKEEEFYYNELELDIEDDGDEDEDEDNDLQTADADPYEKHEERSPVSNYSSGTTGSTAHASEEESSSNISDAVSSPAPSPGPFVLGTSSAPTWSHLDMARPPHEDPEYQRSLCKRLGGTKVSSGAPKGTGRRGSRNGGNASNIPNVFFKFSSSSASTSNPSNNQSTPLNLSVGGGRGSSSHFKSVTPKNSSLLQNGPSAANFTSSQYSSSSSNHNFSSSKLINNASQSFPGANHHHFSNNEDNNYSNYQQQQNNNHHLYHHSKVMAASGINNNSNTFQSTNHNNNSHNNKYLKGTDGAKGGQSILLNGPSTGGGKKGSASPSSSGGGRQNGRNSSGGETRKCRKVYGMQGRDSWCTQCKWKKACTRFTNGVGGGSSKASSSLADASSTTPTTSKGVKHSLSVVPSIA